MFFIWGNDQYLIDANVKKIVSKYNLMPRIIDNDSSENDIIEALTTITIFESKKIVIFKDFSFLKKDNFSKTEFIYDLLKKIEKNHDSNLVIIFVLFVDKLPISNNLINFLYKTATIIEVKKPKDNELMNIVQSIIQKKGASISNEATLKLILYLPNNLYIINSEINKLLNETNNITIEHIEQSISKYHEEGVFLLSNAIIEGDAIQIIENYQTQLINGIDIMMLLAQLSSNFQTAYLIKEYKKEKKTLKEISQISNISFYRIMKINRLLDHGFVYSIEQIIEKLAKLDLDIKRGTIDKQNGFDKFILEIIKKK